MIHKQIALLSLVISLSSFNVNANAIRRCFTHNLCMSIPASPSAAQQKSLMSFSLQIGNALVCLAVWSNHSMRTVTNIFIVNLAVADFFVILFCLPPTVIWDVTETWFLGETMCKVVIYFQVSIEIYLCLLLVLAG